MTDNTQEKSYKVAAENADWYQVVMNQGPPCFHLESPERFCLRAKRWAGHGDIHNYISLADLLEKVAAERSGPVE
jgi:hypothetical protein